jgi:hypothetical protein
MLLFKIGLFPFPRQSGSSRRLQFSLYVKLILYKMTRRFSLVILFVLLSLYDLANVVPTLAKFYHQASEAYEQSCSRHISMIIYYVSIYSLFCSGCWPYTLIYTLLEISHYPFSALKSNLNAFSSLLEGLRTWF